jgi:hypothetical protein
MDARPTALESFWLAVKSCSRKQFYRPLKRARGKVEARHLLLSDKGLLVSSKACLINAL